jgi:hypothetical protein
MKKWLLRIGLGFFSILVLLYGFLMLRSLLPATVNDGNLRLARASIPEGSNAFDALQTAASHLWWPDDQSRQFYDLASDTNWNASLADKVLANNREALAGWDAAAKLTDLQVPEVSSADDLLPYLSDWRKLSELAAVRENVLLHKGQDNEAFDQIISHVQLGQQMQNGHGPWIDYLVGTAVRGMGLIQMQRWAGKTHLTADQLKDYIRQLQFDPDDEGTALANTMRAEYQCTIGTMDAMRKGKMINTDTGKPYAHPTRLLPVLNFSKTKAMFAGEFNALVKAAPHHFNEAKLSEPFSHRPGPVALVLSGNLLGQLWFEMLMPGTGAALVKKSQSDTQLQATRVILALRVYQLTHGNLPSDLNVLVPEFLDVVPADDFDGQPLRYAPDRKIVYSVGQNLKDDGGDDSRSGPSNSRPLDLVYKFDF